MDIIEKINVLIEKIDKDTKLLWENFLKQKALLDTIKEKCERKLKDYQPRLIIHGRSQFAQEILDLINKK